MELSFALDLISIFVIFTIESRTMPLDLTRNIAVILVLSQQSSRPEETMVESFGNEGSGGGMVATFALMNVSEDRDALLRLYVALEDASRVAPDELSVDDRVCGCTVLHLPGQDFVGW